MHSVKIDSNVPFSTRDGATLLSNVFRPDAAGQFPVALTRTPYGKDLNTSTNSLDAVRLAREGYIVVIQDVRGRFASAGEWYPLRNEVEDGYDAVEWAAQLPGSSGKVGMFGGSYCGYTQWSAARTAPPHLHAIVPLVTWSDVRDGVVFRGGALELGVIAFWLLAGLSFDVLLRWAQQRPPLERALAFAGLANEIDRLQTEGYRSLPLNAFEPLAKFDVGAYFFETIAGHSDPESGSAYSIARHFDRVTVPALNVGGWYDLFCQGTLQNYACAANSARDPIRQSKLIVGPWAHSEQSHVIGDFDFGFAAQMQFMNLETDLTALTQRWFDHWLKGSDNGITREPPVKLFIMGENVWRTEREWPLARANYRPYFLHGEGGLSAEKPHTHEPADHYAYDPVDPTPTLGGAFLLNNLFRPGPVDQRPLEARADVLCYTGDTLAEDLEVTGPIVVHLWAASDAPDTDYVARLIDVHPDGRAQNLTDGILRARYRNGPEPQMLEPGRPAEFVIDLWSTAHLFKAGHRLRLDVCSANFPRWDRNLNTGAPLGTDSRPCVAHQTILHDAAHPSRVILPVIPR